MGAGSGVGADTSPSASGNGARGVRDASGSGAGASAAAPRDASAVSTPGDVRLLGRDHPLAGRVWSIRERRFVPPSEVETAVREARYALLGERHGNPEHHALQGRLIAAAARGGRPVALVAEQIDFEQQPAIDACRRDCADFGAELGARVQWSASGWPPYALYRPAFAAAGEARAPVYAGNAGAKRIRVLSRGEAPTETEAPWVARAREPLPALGRERLVSDLKQGHCGHLPEGYADSLVLAQRLRDASMTARLQRAAAASERPAPVVLIAGTGHARRDYGVPLLLDAPSVVIAFVEVASGETRPQDYGPADAYDYLWFTPRVDEPDPCEQFRERLEKMKPATAPPSSAPSTG
jgi:uncharacterized iron-regulated protein